MKAVNEKLRRAVCSLLALAMTLSLFSVPGFSGAAQAAPETSPSSALDTNSTLPDISSPFKALRQNDPSILAAAGGITPYSFPITSVGSSKEKPTLFIDFLGDNTPGFTYTGTSSGTAVPSDKDQSAKQSGGPWEKYGPIGGTGAYTPTAPGTVFWVGVGIDKTKFFELSKGGKGLTGVELGFYYNTKYVQPYTGANTTAPFTPGTPSAYKTELSNANLTPGALVSSLNQWNSNAYEIVEAIPARDVVMDGDTQEVLFGYPRNADMTGSDWKMLYVSLEKKDSDWGSTWGTPNRFSEPNPSDETRYVMMLPFVLVDYDPSDDICFRLARNASVFSMGGNRYGAGTYDSDNTTDSSFGAWEHETRTPGHNLKEMFSFEGDLNIFTGENVKDNHNKATLYLRDSWANDPINNTATLYPSADPSIYVDADGDSIDGLSMGDELTLEVTKGATFTTSITILSGSAVAGSVPLSYVEVKPGEKYTFRMPGDSDVYVIVRYRENPTDKNDYNVHLVKYDPNPTPLPENKAEAKGDDSTGTTNTTVMEPTSPNPKIENIQVAPDNTVTVTVSSHPDYKAVVKAETLGGTDIPLTQPDPDQEIYTFTMPSADVEVTVTYEKLPRHYAELSVDAVADVDIRNTATLSYKEYSENGGTATTPVTMSKTLNGQNGGREDLGPIPADREVRLDIHVLKDYMVSEIRLYNGDDSGRYESTYTDLRPNLQPTTPGNTEDFYLTFPMPDNRVQVHVIFAARRNYTAKLFLQNGEIAEMWGNKDGADDGSGPNPPVLERTNMTSTPRQNTIQVWPGNKVTVDLDPKSGYVVESVTITWGSNNRVVYPDPTDPTGAIPDPVEFAMPPADVNVFVKFKAKPDYNATLVYQDLMGGSVSTSYDASRSGWPKDPMATPVVLDSPTKYNLHQNDRSTAWVQVRPGWYIASVRAVGWDSSPGGRNTGSGNGYPVFSVSGNGYNGGAGGRVEIQVDQPDEDLTVYVVMKQGIPPVDPEYTLTLRVDDPANTSMPRANNWAQVTINSVGPQPVPPVSLGNGNNGYLAPNATYSAPITAGQEVVVEYNADTGYRVAGVSVTPSSYGIVPTPIGSNKVRFYVPAGSTVVTVHFVKAGSTTDPKPYVATLHISGATASELASVLLTNTTAVPPDSTNVHLGTVPAWMGDAFTTQAAADPGRYVSVDVYQGGSVMPWTPTTPGVTNSGDGSFYMPAGNVDVYVNFTNTPPVPDQHNLSLTAYGPSGVTPALAPGDAGEVELVVDGVSVYTVRSDATPVPTYTQKVTDNDPVLLYIRPNSGYVVDRIVYTPNGAVSPVELTPMPTPPGNRVVRFAMPACATAVEVYFRVGTPTGPDGPDKHTANIILRMEDSPGTVVNTSVVGDAQFDNLVPGGGYSRAAVAGTVLDIEALARNGYYISKIEITPKSLGVAGDITGVFASQNMNFIMPDADCTVNVYFRKGWPDDAQLLATLRVHGPSGVPGNNAQLRNLTANTSTAGPIVAGQSQDLRALVGQEMRVKIAKAPGYRVTAPISVKDAAGNDVSYWWVAADEIAFRMPNTWAVADVTFEKDDPTDPRTWKATLYNKTSASTTGELARTPGGPTTGVVVAGASGVIQPLLAGDNLQLTVRNVPTNKVPVVLVRTADGTVVPIPAWTVTSGGTSDVYTVSFPMQDKDVEVYLTETDKPDVLRNEYLATLVVNELGTTTPDPANRASMADAALSTATGSISAAGTAGIRAVVGDTVTINVDNIAPGYAVRSVEVRTASGLLVALAQPTGRSYTYTMPAENAVAVVVFEKHDPSDPKQDLTAQIVVDKASGTGNDAVIRKMGDTTPGVTRLTGLQPGDDIEVCITVQSGYHIQLVTARATDGKVVSVSPLTLPPEQTQNVHFFMPNDDTVVFVRFVADGTLYNITLDVEDHTTPTPNLSNTASIHTGYSGWAGPINHPATPVVVQGSVNDMVKVETNPQPNYYAVVYAVSDDVNRIPVSDLTQDYLVDSTGRTFTFSVPNNNVRVTVHYYPDSVPKPQHKVRLHITGLGGLAGKSPLDYCILPDTYVRELSNPSNTTDLASTPNVMELTVDYLKTLEVKATARPVAGGGYYLQSAYAKVGSTILTPNTGTTVYTPATAPFTGKEFQFTMQNSDVDVYMVFTDQPPVGAYTASLTVTGPADVDWKGDPVYGAAGSAVLTNTSTTPNVATNTVLSNQAYDPATDSVAADPGHQLQVAVDVNPGYAIDRVVVTPLGLTVTPTSVTTDPITKVTTYVYTMPAGDINIDVRLKAVAIDRYKVTLHLDDEYLTKNPTATTSVNNAKVSYTVYELTTDGASMNVPDTQYVCVETNPDVGYYVHHAYAITENGEVLPLVNKSAPGTIVPLQYPNDRPPVDNHMAWFEMPAENVDVYIEFADLTVKPPTGNYSAVLTVLDGGLDPTHASSATMTLRRGTAVWSVSDNSAPGSSAPLSVNATELVTVTLNIAPGWALDTITVTGGVTPDVTISVNPSNPNEYTFRMPAHDVGVVVKLKSVPVTGYKATLHLVDHSSATGNGAVLRDTVSGKSVNIDGGSITGLKGKELLETTVTPQPGVVVRSVIATDATGTHILTDTAGIYDYTMDNHDADITVVFDNDGIPDAEKMYLAIVQKTGSGAAVAGNTASITNTSNPALPSGVIWTGIYGEDPNQRLRVDVNTAPSYTAIITAETKDSMGATVILPVFQLGVVGTVTGYLDVPKSLYDNVIITVEYTTSPVTTNQDLSLRLVDPTSNPANTASVKEMSTTRLSVNGTSTTDGPVSMAVGTNLDLNMAITSGAYLVSAELVDIASGMGVRLSVHSNSATFRMPNAAAEVVVTLAAGTQTPRPHDNLHHTGFPGGASDPLYIDGYLIGTNLGGNQARIQVPDLFHTGATPPNGTVPAFEATKKYDYKLYLRVGEKYVLLRPGVDYDVTTAQSYDPGTDNYTTGGNTGWDFSIRSLRGESALTELLLKGGLLYITATDVTNPATPLAESEYVEVVIPADPNLDKYSATLKIVDSSGIAGNAAAMTIKTTTVTRDGDQIKNLKGDELIRTMASPAPGVRVSAVTVTDSGGTRLLTEIPGGTLRFPYYMTAEDVIITVYFEKEWNPLNPDDTHYIASVSKHGAIAVPGNDADVKNDSRSDLRKGAIWAEGNVGNAMRVTVDVAAGYYATVTAYRTDTGAPIGVAVFGAGPGVTSFDALFTMPQSDVQVEVTFTADAPANLYNDLTLELVGSYGSDPLNAARLQRQSDKVYLLEADADLTTIIATPSDTEPNVAAGTLFDLFTSHAANYYVAKVEVEVTTTPATTPITLTLDSAGAYQNFAMPLGTTVVKVYFKDKTTDPRTPRPYDPDHSVAYNSPAYVAGSADDLSSPTQEGWIRAVNAPDDSLGRKQITVLVPTLHDDTYTPISATAALGSADIANAGEYKFYWYDGFAYQELKQGVGNDILVSGTDVTGTYTTGGTTFDGREMTLTVLRPGSILDYYIKRGGRIYVTSNKTPANPATESDYTQVVIPRIYTATLHYKLEDGGVTIPGTGAKMEAWGLSTTVDGATLSGTNGTEVVKVNSIQEPTGYHLDGVVATTVSGTVNVLEGATAGQYEYTMVNEDVDIYVVYKKDDDPLRDKGPWIATVIKVNDGGLAGNTAAIEDLDVTIPAYQKGSIWTAAYENNVVRVDVTTEPGWYAVITAQTVSGTGVTVTQFATGTQNFYGLFYMPNDHVNVTVEYFHGPLPDYDLTLEVSGADSRSDNSATITLPGGITMVAHGGSTSTTATVAANTPLPLTTTTATSPNYSVKSVTMEVNGNGILIDIPLVGGASLPIPMMPMGNTVITVTFQAGAQTARPYDPDHSVAYNAANYPVPGTNPDLSDTGMEGWILAERVDGNHFKVTVPTLHSTKPAAPGTLYNAGDAANQPTYKLYWKDNMGVFHLLVEGTDINITKQSIDGSYTDGTNTYDSYTLEVEVPLPNPASGANANTVGTFWGGYTLQEYIKNGGSIYITATGGASGILESEKTEVVFTRTDTYTATLHHKLVDTTSGTPVTVPTGATMTVGAIDVTTDGGKITGLNGDESVRVHNILKPTDYHVVGVVATTSAGSQNVPLNPVSGEYEYTMVYKDVDLIVVYERDDDPLRDKGPLIATVIKDGDGGLAGNTAAIVDTDVTIPDHQKGDIWTAAYVDNTVRVDVTTEPGWYALITAETVSGVKVPVAQFVTGPQSFYGLFYMANEDVNVTVKYIHGPLPSYDLTLETVGTASMSGNQATLEADGMGSATITGMDTTVQVPSAGIQVPAGTILKLSTGVEPGYHVASVKLKIGGVTLTPDIDIPLIDGKSLPDPTMPMGDATVIVTYAPGNQTARPYDPDHSVAYNAANYPVSSTNPDLSRTHMEGWILAEKDATDPTHTKFSIHVPTLHSAAPAAPGTLYNAGDAANQPTYQLYWKDAMGVFHPLVDGTDISITRQWVDGSYTDGTNTYGSYTLEVQILLPNPASPPNDHTVGTFWGGYTLQQYMKKGGSIYITATGGASGTAESEKTEVVFKSEEYTATLHIVNHSSLPDPGTVSMTDTFNTVTKDGDSFGTAGNATITTTVTPKPGVVVRSVIATDGAGSHVLSPDPITGKYDYTMNNHDVDITVIFDNADDPDAEEMYLAIVQKTGAGATVAGNTASITNTTNPALPKGSIWTGIYGETPMQRVQVDVTTDPSYYATITAETKDALGATVTLPVLQLGTTGTVTAYVDIPSSLYDNVIITVNYETTAPATQYELTLEMVDPNASTSNTAQINTAGLLRVDGVSTADGPELVTVGTALNVTTVVGIGSLLKVEIESGGITTVLTTRAGVTPFAMPNGDAKVTVTLLEAGKRTPRPHDNLHHGGFPSGSNGTAYIDGYLDGTNLGSNRALIEVPNLFHTGSTPPSGTVPAFDAPDKKYEYKLYLKNGGSYVELQKGVDYDVIADGSYDPGTYNATTGVTAHNDTGWQFTIRSLRGESALTQLLLDGGLLYITATDVTDPANVLAESEYVEVVLPADPNKPTPSDPTKGYKATLWVVDNSGVAGNFAGMYIDTKTPVEYPNATYPANGSPVDAAQGVITGLRGDELVRTTVQAATGARISAVTVTDSAGTRLLIQIPKGGTLPQRFPYYMTGEDVTITVYFEKDDPANPKDTRYIAAVAKYGAIAVPDNEAQVVNTTNTALGKDSGAYPHWAEGYQDDVMKVSIGLADGYYAQVEAFHKPSGTPITLPQTIFGPGPYHISTDTFVFTIDMPASDVQINVTFVRELSGDLRPYDPDNTSNSLYKDHWITSENQGDRLVVIVPELNRDDGTDPTEVDKAKHEFHFYMSVDGATAESLENVVTLSHPDPTSTSGDPYENDIYYADPSTPSGTTPTKYHGARFILTVKTDKEIDDLATAGTITPADALRAKELALLLRAIMDNAGTDEAIRSGVKDGAGTLTKTRLYITHTDATNAGFESDQVDFEIPRYYSLTGELESYAPAHIATLSLEIFDASIPGGGAYLAPDYTYRPDTPYHMVVELSEKVGNGLWKQDFTFKSSKLAEKKYRFVAEKAAHITYRRPEVVLASTPAAAIGRYDPTTLTFSFDAPIALIAGDIDGNQQVKFRDWDRLISYIYNTREWTKTPDAASGTADEWAKSVFNPDSEAYAADLTGDGRIDDRDELVLMHKRNYNRSERHYNSPTGLDPANPIAASFALRRTMRMAPRMATNVVNDLWEDDELAIPEWAAELVRAGIRVPLWAIELIGEEKNVPDWAIQMLRQEQTVPDWVVELLQAEEELPDWALTLIEKGETLPTEPVEPEKDKTYSIDKDTELKPIRPGQDDELDAQPGDKDDTYTIAPDTELKPIEGAGQEQPPMEDAPEDTGAEAGAPEDDISVVTPSEDSGQEEEDPVDSAPEEESPEDSAPAKDSEPDDSPSEDEDPEDSVSGDSAPEPDDSTEDGASENEDPEVSVPAGDSEPEPDDSTEDGTSEDEDPEDSVSGDSIPEPDDNDSQAEEPVDKTREETDYVTESPEKAENETTLSGASGEVMEDSETFGGEAEDLPLAVGTSPTEPVG